MTAYHVPPGKSPDSRRAEKRVTVAAAAVPGSDAGAPGAACAGGDERPTAGSAAVHTMDSPSGLRATDDVRTMTTTSRTTVNTACIGVPPTWACLKQNSGGGC